MNFRLDDTIAAIATPPGEGGLCIIRMSGLKSYAIADQVFRGSSLPSKCKSHTVLYGKIKEPGSNLTIDEVLLSILRAPRTYTREDIVEISGHGGYVTGRRILDLLIINGARHADPGEFTKRAFVNGRIDLVQAEAVAELIRARTDASARAAIRQLGGHFSSDIVDLRLRILSVLALIEVGIDFTEEGIKEIETGHILNLLITIRSDLSDIYNNALKYKVLRDGLRIAIVGKPNVGKSTLLNIILDRNRAIVDPSPGTTRDTIEEMMDLDGIPVTFIDTAGIHRSSDPIETQGIIRAQAEIQSSDLVLVVFDGSTQLTQDDFHFMKSISHNRLFVVFNKSDIATKARIHHFEKGGQYKFIYISALTGEGVDALKNLIVHSVISDETNFESDILLNSRQQEHLHIALAKLSIGINIIGNEEGSEIAAIEIRDVAYHLGSIIGLEIGDDILDLVFSQFCIGK